MDATHVAGVFWSNPLDLDGSRQQQPEHESSQYQGVHTDSVSPLPALGTPVWPRGCSSGGGANRQCPFGPRVSSFSTKHLRLAARGLEVRAWLGRPGARPQPSAFLLPAELAAGLKGQCSVLEAGEGIPPATPAAPAVALGGLPGLSQTPLGFAPRGDRSGPRGDPRGSAFRVCSLSRSCKAPLATHSDTCRFQGPRCGRLGASLRLRTREWEQTAVTWVYLLGRPCDPTAVPSPCSEPSPPGSLVVQWKSGEDRCPRRVSVPFHVD